MPDPLPIIRTSERSDFKRCEWQWWMRWRLGLTPERTKTALWFGTGWHRVMDARYPVGRKRGTRKAMRKAWDNYCGNTTRQMMVDGQSWDDAEFGDAKELGFLLIDAYIEEHGVDEQWEVLAVEKAFQIDVPHPTSPDVILAVYAGTVDKVMRNILTGEIWLWDHKTARAFPDFRFLTLDDQPGSYLWVGEEVFKFLKVLKETEHIEGIIFDYARKGKPDTRPMNEDGMRLNQDGSVSKKQPSPLFHREYIDANDYKRVQMARRVQVEAARMATARSYGSIDLLMKTPTKDCPRQCPVFELCEAHEAGDDWEELIDGMFIRLDPYRDHRAAMEAGGVAL